MMSQAVDDIAIVGAGPIGLEMAVAAARAGLSHRVFDAGAVGHTMLSIFPPRMHWFSSNDRIAIAGLPIQTTDQTKATREEYLAYLRQVVRLCDLQVHTYQPVVNIQPNDAAGHFELTTRPQTGDRTWQARNVVLATGGTHYPKKLGIEGDELPHVQTRLDEPHAYFGTNLLIVGGKNSAVESALRCFHAGANVTLSYRGAEFEQGAVKYWLLPELLGRIRGGEIHCYYRTVPVDITPERVTLKNLDDGSTFDVPADFVLEQIGFRADMSLFERAGVDLQGDNRKPRHDRSTMQTNVPGLYVAGTAAAGEQQSYRLFLENCHIHVDRIVASIAGQPPPADAQSPAMPES